MFSRTAGTFSALVIGIETWLWESAGHEFAEQPSLGVGSPCHIQVGHENTSFGKPLLRQLRVFDRVASRPVSDILTFSLLALVSVPRRRNVGSHNKLIPRHTGAPCPMRARKLVPRFCHWVEA
jgi:hypothetical protein